MQNQSRNHNCIGLDADMVCCLNLPPSTAAPFFLSVWLILNIVGFPIAFQEDVLDRHITGLLLNPYIKGNKYYIW